MLRAPDLRWRAPSSPWPMLARQRVREEARCTIPGCRMVTHQRSYVQHTFNTQVHAALFMHGGGSCAAVEGRPAAAVLPLASRQLRQAPAPRTASIPAPCRPCTQAEGLRRLLAQAARERLEGRLGPRTLGGRLRRLELQLYVSCDAGHGEGGPASTAKLRPTRAGWSAGLLGPLAADATHSASLPPPVGCRQLRPQHAGQRAAGASAACGDPAAGVAELQRAAGEDSRGAGRAGRDAAAG